MNCLIEVYTVTGCGPGEGGGQLDIVHSITWRMIGEMLIWDANIGFYSFLQHFYKLVSSKNKPFFKGFAAKVPTRVECHCPSIHNNDVSWCERGLSNKEGKEGK